MTLFGKSRKRKASESRSAASKALPSDTVPYRQRSPPPAYLSPQLSHQHVVPCPYGVPQTYPLAQESHWQAAVPHHYAPYASAPSQLQMPLSPPPTPPVMSHRPYAQQQKWSSSTNLVQMTSCPIVGRTVGYLNRGAALCDLIGDKFNDVISLIDNEAFSGNERDLVFTYNQYAPASPPQYTHNMVRSLQHLQLNQASVGEQQQSTTIDKGAPRIIKANLFLKAAMYANSYLPPHLPPLRVYMPTWPLLCLAARYSRDAYEKPRGAEKDTFVDADCRLGTKAMVLKSVPLDDMNTVVLAIRGTKTTNFVDWGVNLRTDPTAPIGFLDDPGNLCHGGFLDVARKMIKPIAARLRQLLEENPSRASFSLLLTGHSAGAAVAALLYAHMLSKTVKSELNILTDCFKRVHMVSFGAPPVSLLPLMKPEDGEKRLRKCLFLSFINEGDPVPRIEIPYFKSLLELYASPAPKINSSHALTAPSMPASTSKLNLSPGQGKSHEKRPKLPARSVTAPAGEIWPMSNVVWPVPPATLSNAGRCVVLRVPRNGPQDDVRACITTDEQLRCVIFGEPMMHMMELYARRIETLAKKAVTASFKS